MQKSASKKSRNSHPLLRNQENEVRELNKRLGEERVGYALEWFSSITGVKYDKPTMVQLGGIKKEYDGTHWDGTIWLNSVDVETVAHECAHFIRYSKGLDKFRCSGIRIGDAIGLSDMIKESCAGIVGALCHENNSGCVPIERLMEMDYITPSRYRKVQAVIMDGVSSLFDGKIVIDESNPTKAIIQMLRETKEKLRTKLNYKDPMCHEVGYTFSSLFYFNREMDAGRMLKDALTMPQEALIDEVLSLPNSEKALNAFKKMRADIDLERKISRTFELVGTVIPQLRPI